MKRKIGLLLAIICLLIAMQLSADNNTELTELRVAIDNNYPPYFFLTKSGKYQGILYDIWKLWESKTGIKVIFIGADWNEAINMVDSGQAQVLETVFSTDERRLKYEFNAPYAEINVPVFCRKDLTGVTKIEDLQSYVIGVKDGDAVIEYLKACNVTGIRKYKSYQDVINAAINNEIHIFSVDEPPALYYLDKLNYGKEFRLAFMLYTGRFHCAVLKENAELLPIIKGGFEKISAKEKEEITQKWKAKSLPVYNYYKYKYTIMFIIVLFASIALGLLLVSCYLRKIVKKKTQDLEKVMIELEESKKRIEAYISVIPDFMFVFNEKDEIIDYRAADKEKLYAPPKEFLFKNIVDILPKEVADIYIEKIKILKQTKKIQSFEYSLSVKDKIDFYYAQVVLLSEKEYLCIVQIVTEKKQIEEQIFLSNKLDSLGQLAGGIAHGFNNMLTGVIGNLSMIKHYCQEDSSIFKFAEQAESSAIRGKQLTAHLLTFAKGGAPVLSFIDINTLIMDTVSFALEGSNCVASHDLVEDYISIKADASQLRQAIYNIIVNAYQSMPKGGIIYITSEIEYPDKADKLGLTDGRYLKIKIKDTGSGISFEHLDRVFDPYFSTKNNTGLGLTISYSVLKKHNGAIEIRSNNGKGTLVALYLPIDNEECELIMTKDSVSYGDSNALNNKVLFMDDDEQIRFIGSEMLTILGYDVILCKDGDETIELLKDYQEKNVVVDYLIMDLTIPGKTGGKEAIKSIREFNKTIFAIVTSGYSTDPVMANFADYGFDAVLTKPFDLEMLKDVLKYKNCND